MLNIEQQSIVTTQVAPANFIKTTIYIQENVLDYLDINSKCSKETRQCFFQGLNRACAKHRATINRDDASSARKFYKNHNLHTGERFRLS